VYGTSANASSQRGLLFMVTTNTRLGSQDTEFVGLVEQVNDYMSIGHESPEKTVVMVTSGSTSGPRALLDLAICLSLKARGVRVIPVAPEETTAHPGSTIITALKHLSSSAQHDVTMYADKHDQKVAEVYADAVTPDTLNSITRGGFNVGTEAAKLVSATVLSDSAGGSREQVSALKKHVEKIVLQQCSYERLSARETPHAVVISGWHHYPWTLPALQAHNSGLPTYVVELDQITFSSRCFELGKEEVIHTPKVPFLQSSSQDGHDCAWTLRTVQDVLPGGNAFLDWLCDSVVAGQSLKALTIPATTPQSASTVRYLQGFDEQGEVSIVGKVVRRNIFPSKGDKVRQLLESDRHLNFSQWGVVPAQVAATVESGFELTLEHPKVPIISYTHEWPSEMVREALQFEIRLQENLIKNQFFLKDFGALQNVLFNGCTPTWVDYLSICSLSDLPSQAWLLEGLPVQEFSSPLLSCFFSQMWKRVFVPHSLMPFLLLASGSPTARRRILDTAMNTSSETITEAELAMLPHDARQLIAGAQCKLEQFAKAGDLLSTLACTRDLLASIPNPFSYSGYVDYYKDKNEEFLFEPSPSWKPKQWGVYEALKKYSPSTVLDIGANTGWFSILAARMGAHVTAGEIDEACANVLFSKARALSLPILPLVLNILDLQPEVPAWKGYNASNCSRLSVQKNSGPVLLAAEERLRSDAVMALAIIHHLVLGVGKKLEEIIDTLSRLSRKTIIVEFVDISDPLISAEPDFFPALQRDKGVAAGYSRDNLEALLRSRFTEISVTPLSQSRFLYVASR
jgi:hypothetical protein